MLGQGQALIPLLSDPLGRGWNLFGMAAYSPDLPLVSARLTWYVAVSAIVAGHVIAVWLAHRLTLRAFGARRAAVVASVPLTILMVVYTALSLSVIAGPLVRFRTPDPPYSQLGPAGQTVGQQADAGGASIFFAPVVDLGPVRSTIQQDGTHGEGRPAMINGRGGATRR